MVMFTGSVATGKKVMAQAAETLTPVSLELGGKDPMIVLADADLERAANAAVRYGLNNSGQVCISVERDLRRGAGLRRVPRAGDARRSRRCARVRPASPASVDVGAIIFPPQIELIEAHVRDAVEQGRARCVTGGKRAEPARAASSSRRCSTDVDHSMRCMIEETFGPTLPVMRVADAEEAIALANDGPVRAPGVGLDPRHRARGAAGPPGRGGGRRASTTRRSTTRALELPMGGWKASGLGSRHGAGRDPQVHEAPVADDHPGLRAVARAHMFPYSAQVTADDRRDAARALAASELFSDAQRATLAALCDTLIPSLEPPRGRAAIRTGFWARAASHTRGARGDRDRAAAGRSPRRSRSRGCAACSTRSAEKGWSPTTPQEAREAIVHAFMRLGPRGARRDLDALRGSDDDAVTTRFPTSAPAATRTGTAMGYPGPQAPPPDVPKPLTDPPPEPAAERGDRGRRLRRRLRRRRRRDRRRARGRRQAGLRARDGRLLTTRPTSTSSSSAPTSAST